MAEVPSVGERDPGQQVVITATESAVKDCDSRSAAAQIAKNLVISRAGRIVLRNGLGDSPFRTRGSGRLLTFRD